MKVAINESTLAAIGDAIREKTDTTDLIAPGDMPGKIRSITTGDGGDLTDILHFDNQTGYHMFSYGAWDNFIDNYGSSIRLSNISNASYMFYNSNLSNIPFTIDAYNDLTAMFMNAKNLLEVPKIQITSFNSQLNVNNMFAECNSLKNIDLDFLPDTNNNSGWYSYFNRMFYNCSSLRIITGLERLRATYMENEDYPTYNDTFYNCMALDSIDNLYPTELQRYSLSKSVCSKTCFSGCLRLKDMTFALQANGEPYTRQWRNQVIYLTDGVGYNTYYNTNNGNWYENANWGIPEDKEVFDDATYQALKNDPDWHTRDINYCRYNHDSAVNTINSLPDTSVYVAANGGTNIINFKGASGSKTDGGAINTLTNEEIAVAAAKGWTVSFT